MKYSGLFTNLETRLEIVLDVHGCSGTLGDWRRAETSALRMENGKKRKRKKKKKEQNRETLC